MISFLRNQVLEDTRRQLRFVKRRFKRQFVIFDVLLKYKYQTKGLNVEITNNTFTFNKFTTYIDNLQ